MSNRTVKKLSDRVVEYIISRKTVELASLTAVKTAAALGVDLSHMERVFKADQKITPDRFIIREKMHRPVFLLDKDKDISIRELAERVGFPGVQQFAGEFKDYFLVDPHTYKELIAL